MCTYSFWSECILCHCWLSNFVLLPHTIFFMSIVGMMHQIIFTCEYFVYRINWPSAQKQSKPNQSKADRCNAVYCCYMLQSIKVKVNSVWRNTNYVSRLTIKYKLINFSSDSLLLLLSLLNIITWECMHAHSQHFPFNRTFNNFPWFKCKHLLISDGLHGLY